MSDAKMISKVMVPHQHACPAVYNTHRGQWDTPWYLDTWTPAPHEYRDSIGRKSSGGRRWLRLRCNARECPAEAILSVDAIEALAAPEDTL